MAGAPAHVDLLRPPPLPGSALIHVPGSWNFGFSWDFEFWILDLPAGAPAITQPPAELPPLAGPAATNVNLRRLRSTNVKRKRQRGSLAMSDVFLMSIEY